MATNCATGVYTLSYTDNTKNPITVNKQTLIQNIVDITLLGKARKEYGEVFDANLVHMLENFACPENPSNPGNPNLNITVANVLEQPTQGQLWYNTTQLKLFVYSGTAWVPLGAASDIGGNSGIIAHGEQLPLPISPITGYQFTYDQCNWMVSPFNFPSEIDYMICYTNSEGLVTSEYRVSSTQTITSGYAFYQIIGIKNNENEGTDNPVTPPIPSATPLPNVSPTPSPSIGSSPTPTPSITPTTTKTPQPSPTGTPNPSPTQSPSTTPIATTTPTPTPTTSIQPIKGTLFITPSLGYPQGVNTSFVSPCSTNAASDSNCFYTLGLVLQNVSGGVPPYTVDFSNINFTSTIVSTNGGPPVTSQNTYSYSGASGSATSPVRTGATQTSVLQMTGTISEASGQLNCYNGSWSLGIAGGSYVNITDSAGNTLTLYTPAGANGNVYGTAYTTPQGAYSDSWLSTGNCTASSDADVATSGTPTVTGTLTPTPSASVTPTPSPNTQGIVACVSVKSFLPNDILAHQVSVGDSLSTTDPYDFFNSGTNEVTYAKTEIATCVRITTTSGATLVCSITAPIPTLDNGYMLAPTLINRSVPVMRHNITAWEVVTQIDVLEPQEVRHITVGDRCFWAGETTEAYILHHNTKGN